MRQGSSREACYVVTSGQARIEVERPTAGGDGVAAYLGPGEVCGEFSVLDDSPRTASAYAHPDVATRRLSVPALRTLCARDPAQRGSRCCGAGFSATVSNCRMHSCS